MGLHLVRPGQPVIVVEGATDAAVCGPGFVATLGAKCSQDQAALIAASGASEAIVLFDGDTGGREGAPKVALTLGSALPTRYATCPEGTDPGTLGRDRSIQIAHSALPLHGQPSLSPKPIDIPKTNLPLPFLQSLEKR